jgi:peroxiredoxin Q/BCP
MKEVIIFVLTMMFITYLHAGDILKTGSDAPDFSLKDADGKVHKLSGYRGKTVALYFYPKDDTRGCTAEACNLRDNYETLLTRGLVILGVSYDDSASHRSFRDKHNLPFALLSDTEKKVAELYGAKPALIGSIMPKRITYLIDSEGKVMHVFESVDTGNHTAQILKVLDSASE